MGLSRVLLATFMASVESAWSENLTAQGSDGDLRVDHDQAECTADEGQCRPCHWEHDSSDLGWSYTNDRARPKAMQL